MPHAPQAPTFQLLSARCRIAAAAVVVASMLPGCATPTAPGTRSAAGSPGVRSDALAVERDWLHSWFKGTPVRIELRGDGELNVEVPREHCFDRGRDTVKPALAAVLDKVAQSMRRVPDAMLALVAAPADGAEPSQLAQRRASRVQRHLRGRGVPPDRIGPPSTTVAPAVQLRIVRPEL